MESISVSIVSPSAEASSRTWSAMATIALGIGILFVVGFLQAPVAHNAAHDTRHANGFPCH